MVNKLRAGVDHPNATIRILPGFRDAIEASRSVKMRGGQDFLAGSELGFAPRFEGGLELHGGPGARPESAGNGQSAARRRTRRAWPLWDRERQIKAR